MWYGEITSELNDLYDQYYEMFGCDPDGYDELEYGPNDYTAYVNDIKAAINKGEELPCFVE